MLLNRLPHPFLFSIHLSQARQFGAPIVALESAVITHGLPRPDNLKLARDLEAEVRKGGATPATIALFNGKIKIGLTEPELEALSLLENPRKISLRDFGIALAGNLSGGTTVAATLFAAAMAGIQVFATGGIGGVHRGGSGDVSADLPQLGKSPVLVVCAGAKSILDLPATREYLETEGVPVLGYQTDEFPAFYARKSGLPVDHRVESAEEAAKIALCSWDAGLKSAVLLVVPPPEATALPSQAVERAIATALEEAAQQDIHGGALTPFLLGRVSKLTGGDSLRANLALLHNNAGIAGHVAAAMGDLRKAEPI